MTRYNQFSRILALVLSIVLMAMTFTGCFGGKETPDATDDPNAIATLPTVNPAPTETSPLPSETEAQSVMGTVNTDKLNVRTKANQNSASVKKLAVGTRLEILEQLTVEETTWGRIEEGWVNMKFVTLDSDTENSSPVIEDPGTVENETPEETTPDVPAATTGSGKGKMGTVDTETLRIRKGPGTKYDIVGTVKEGDRVEILETDGNWGKIDKGWISLKFVKMDGASSSSSDKKDNSSSSTDKKYSTLVTDGNTKALGKVKVRDTALNVRYGPGTDYDPCGGVKAGETLTYYQKSGNWIRISNGWISCKSKYVTEVDSDSSSSSDKQTTGTNTTFKKGTATVKVNTSLTIRESASTDAKQVGSYKNGDKVTITEVNGEWGKTDKGWINLKYVVFD